MEDIKTNNADKAAFACVGYSPEAGSYLQDGLTKREYFAAKAMQGLLSADDVRRYDAEDIASQAIECANALLKALGNEA